MKLSSVLGKFVELINQEEPEFFLPDKATLPQIRNANNLNTNNHIEFRKDLLMKSGYYVIIVGGIAYLLPKITDSVIKIMGHKKELEKKSEKED